MITNNSRYLVTRKGEDIIIIIIQLEKQNKLQHHSFINIQPLHKTHYLFRIKCERRLTITSHDNGRWQSFLIR